MHKHEPSAINYLISLKYDWISQYHLQRFKCRKCGIRLQIQEKEQHRFNVTTQIIYLLTILLFFLASYIFISFSIILTVLCCFLIILAALFAIYIFICKKATFISIDYKGKENPNNTNK